jgi:predicted O-methyltransferase YrrM
MFGTAKQWAIAAYKAAMSGIVGGNLASLSFLRHPRSMVAYWQHCMFTWQLASGNGLPQVQLHDLLPVEEITDVTILPTSGNFIPWDSSFAKDAMYLSLICRAIHAKQVFEIGTLYGYTAFLLALNTSESARIFTLDIPADAGLALNATISDVATRIANYKANQLIFQGSPVEGKITVLKGDSANFDFSRWYGQIDVFFIDGSHSYEYVKSDTEHALKCCHSGSVILWHDYGRWGVNGVSKYLHKLSQQFPTLSRLPGSSMAVLRVP